MRANSLPLIADSRIVVSLNAVIWEMRVKTGALDGCTVCGPLNRAD